MALGGGTPSMLASGPMLPTVIAAGATSVYWANVDESGTVMEVPLGGGPATTIASGQHYPEGIRARGGSVYWTVAQLDGPAFVREASAAGPLVTLVSGLSAGAIAVDDTNVYFAADDSIMRVPIGRGTVVTLASGQRPSAVAVDATSVYWANWGEGVPPSSTVMRLTPK